MTAAGSGPAATVSGRTNKEVPSASPTDLRVADKDSSSVSLSWKPPPAYHHNGQLIGYTVEIKDVDGVSQQPSKQSDSTFAKIDGLKSDTEYKFHVSARTAAGSGPTATVSEHTNKEEVEMDGVLSHADLYDLKLALTEVLEKLNKKGVDLKTAAESGQLVTKRKVVECLESIGEHHYSHLLRKSGGVKEVFQNVLDRKLKEWGKEEILPVLKIILCGVPRSGKTSFWRNLVNKPSQDPLSTTLAECHSIDVKVEHATLLDWNLCDDSDSTEVTAEIYKKIFEKVTQEQATETSQKDSEEQASERSQKDSEERVQASGTPQDVPKDKTSNAPTKLTSDDEGEQNPKSDFTSQGKSTIASNIRSDIDSIFEKLKETSGIVSGNPNLGKVELMINLIDTGGQSAFLHLLPLLTIGNGLYLIFFSYKYSLEEGHADEFKGERGPIKLSHEYTQIDLILQALRCVSTNITEHDKSDVHVKVLIVGTHKEKCGDHTPVDDLIKKKVQPFFDKNVLEYANVTNSELLVLRVNNNDKDEFKEHRITLDHLIKKIKFPQKKLSGCWLLFSIVIRQLKKDILLYDDCVYIGRKLSMSESDVKFALRHMHENVGIVMHFGDVSCLQDIVICDVAIIFRSISAMIIETYYDPSACTEDYLRFKKHATFTYNSFKEKGKKEHKELLQHDKLIVLLQHIGAIAPIKPDSTFKCTLCQTDVVHEKPKHCIHEEYILPCVLPDAMPCDLKRIEEQCREKSTPLVISFEGEYAPIGGFCYLFTKLIADQQKWELCMPNPHSPNEADFHKRIYRNKVTFNFNKKFYITLISTPYCFKVFVEDADCSRYHQVWTAIRDSLDKCPNEAIQKKFKPAFECTCSHKEELHFMILYDWTPHAKQLTAICKKNDQKRPTEEVRVAKYTAWFEELKPVVSEPEHSSEAVSPRLIQAPPSVPEPYSSSEHRPSAEDHDGNPDGVPSARPRGLEVTHKDSNSVSLRWNPPPAENYNGQIIEYTVEIKDVNGEPQRAPKYPTKTRVTIDGLNSDTMYKFHVSAMTAAGSAGHAAIVSVRTDKEDFSVLKCSIGLLIAAIVIALIIIILCVVLALLVSGAAASIIVAGIGPIVLIIIAAIGFIKPDLLKDCLRYCRKSCSCCKNDA